MRYKLLALLLAGIPALAQTPAFVQGVQGTGAGTNLPVTFTLGSAPTSGNLLVDVLNYNTYGDYDFTAPDQTWTCPTVGGRSAGVSVRTLICTHIVIPGDGTAYTWGVNNSNSEPSAAGGVLFEVSGAVGIQSGFSVSTTSVSTVTTPSITPSVTGTLPVVGTYGGNTASTPAGYTLIASPWSSFYSNTLAGTSPVSVTMNVGNTFGNAVSYTMLLTPGTFASPTTATPGAGSYSPGQTVALATTTAGGVIHYTLDNSAPTCSSTTYTGTLTLSATQQLNSIVCASGFTPSAVQYRTYVIGGGTLVGISLGPNAPLNGYVPWSTDLWHTDIFSAAVDPDSAAIIASLRGSDSTGTFFNFGPGLGIPYNTVDSTITRAVVVNYYGTDYNPVENDASYAPMPNDLQIESENGVPAPDCGFIGDQHAIVIDRPTGGIYEFYRAQKGCVGSYNFAAWNAAIMDFSGTTSADRPYTYTSADAGGLSVFEGLARYEEILSGTINHALRMDVKFPAYTTVTGHQYAYFVPPALHGSVGASGGLAVYGDRLRLKASVDISGYSPTCQILLTGEKHFGLIIADIGNTGYVDGVPDPRWNRSELTCGSMDFNNYEVVQRTASPAYYATNSQYPCGLPSGNPIPCTGARGSGTPPAIASFTASPSTVTYPACTTLSWSTTGANTLFIDRVGFVRGTSTTYCPTATGTVTVTLTASNNFLVNDDGSGDGSRPTSTATVTVNGGPSNPTSSLSGRAVLSGSAKLQ